METLFRKKNSTKDDKFYHRKHKIVINISKPNNIWNL